LLQSELQKSLNTLRSYFVSWHCAVEVCTPRIPRGGDGGGGEGGGGGRGEGVVGGREGWRGGLGREGGERGREE